MELDRKISLSKSQQKTFGVVPYFFAASLNALYRLHTDEGFRKPELSTWRDEACVELRRGVVRVLVQYAWPNFVEVRVARDGQPRNVHFVLYETFEGVGKDNVTALAEPLYEYLLAAADRILDNIGDE